MEHIYRKEKGEGMCYMDCKESISRSNFECGHITPSSVGGKCDIYNLRPICSNCNKSMGTKNMLDFYKNGGFKINQQNNNEIIPIINKVDITPNIKKTGKVIKSRMDKVIEKLDSKDICYLLRVRNAKELYQEKNLSELKNMLDEDKFRSFLKGDTTKYYGKCENYGYDDCIFDDHESSYCDKNKGKCIRKILYKINKSELLFYINKINNKANKNMSHSELVECLDLDYL